MAKNQDCYLQTQTVYQINQTKTYYLYEDFSRNKNMFGFSEYPENSKLFNTANKQ